MKLEKLFYAKDNKLYSLDNTQITTQNCPVLQAEDIVKGNTQPTSFAAVSIKWSTIGLNEENYNEEFLAQLRDYLMKLEEKKLYTFIVPVCDSNQDKNINENFTAAIKHCARRIKDCASVIGFAIPKEVEKDYFTQELLAKHSHYIFFSKDSKVLENKEVAEY